MSTALPRFADTLVVGGGSSGAAVAGRLAELTGEHIVLLEAGPDYGPLSGAWPAELLDARHIPESHGWELTSGTSYPGRVIPFPRARVIGGCSAHNGCAAIWGSHRDYDGWAASGNPGWSTAELLPLFHAANERMRVRIPTMDEVQPFQRAFIEAAVNAEIPLVEDLNDLYQDTGVAPSPVNIAGGVRWNSAFAYLDPVRHVPRLTVIGNATVDRLLVERGRATGADVLAGDKRERILAGRIVLCAGTYGSPAILLRSGIGNPAELQAAGIPVCHPLSGVGRNLHDHPAVELHFTGTSRLIEHMRQFMEKGWLPEEQAIAKARSSSCTNSFDIHIYPVGGPYSDPQRQTWRFLIPVACMTPRSRGALRITSPDCTRPPSIDHRYLSDDNGHDRLVLCDAVQLARQVAATPPLADLIGQELAPGPAVRSAQDIADWIDHAVVHYYHPVGTCKMGPASDAEAVVDSRGKVHGLDNVFVADCSIMPVIPRANTNIPAIVIGERIARWLAQVEGTDAPSSR